MVGGIFFFKKFGVEAVVGQSCSEQGTPHPFLVSPTTDRLADPSVMGVPIILHDTPNIGCF